MSIVLATHMQEIHPNVQTALKCYKPYHSMMQIILTGYDVPKINRAVSAILKNMSRFNIKILKNPSVQNVGRSDSEPKLWGCNYDDVTRKVMTVDGSFVDMKKLVNVKTPDGVLVEMRFVQVN